MFGNVDLVNDRVMPGAFAKSLGKWEESGDPIPVIWSHRWDDPQAHIGKVVDAEERDEGLWVKGQLDVDAPFAAHVNRLLTERRVKEFSFAYDVVDEKRAKDGANELRELDLIEVGPTLKGANPETQLLAAKAGLFGEGVTMEPAETPTGEKAVVSLTGSLEEHRAQVAAAVQDWAFNSFGGDVFAAYPEATYDDRVVVYVEMWDEPWGGGRYYQASYSRDDDGDIELGDPAEVTIEASVVPKTRGTAAEKDAKRRTHSSDGGEVKSDANPETREGKGEKPKTRSPLYLLAEVELEALDAGMPFV